MFRHSFKFLIPALLLVGCTVEPPTPSQDKVQRLAVMIQALDSTVPTQEVMRLSRDIFLQTNKLVKQYGLTYPPLWHNTLVNLGLKEKGLCYHWADALYIHLHSKGYEHFEFHLIGSDIGSYLFEHNALAVVKKGQEIEEGIVIDPWRNSGALYFSKIKEDDAYSWSHRADRGCLSALSGLNQ